MSVRDPWQPPSIIHLFTQRMIVDYQFVMKLIKHFITEAKANWLQRNCNGEKRNQDDMCSSYHSRTPIYSPLNINMRRRAWGIRPAVVQGLIPDESIPRAAPCWVWILLGPHGDSKAPNHS